MSSENNSRSSRPSSKAAFRDSLADLNLPPGLLSSVLQRYQSCDSWLWIVDNSSFMKVRDAHVGRVEPGGAIKRVDGVSRWQELQVAMAAHTKMSSNCWMPTKYRLVNEPTGKAAGEPLKFGLCWSSPGQIPSEMNHIENIMNNDSLGHTECKLTSRVESLSKVIASAESTFSEKNKRLTVVICTQGMPTNSKGQSSKAIRQEFEQEMWKLSKLPVKIVVRLTTDDEKVMEMYSDMCARFDGIDVLDDWWGEAMEVYLHNPWLTYSLGLHRLREAGLAPDIFSVLDERPLTLDEIHQLSELLFLGEDGSGEIPLPPYQPTRKSQLQRTSWLTNWVPFMTEMKNLVGRQKLQWNPLKKRMTPWIDLKKLESNLREQVGDTSPSQNPSSHAQFTSSRSYFTRGNKSYQNKSSRTYHDPAAGNHRQTFANSKPNPKWQQHLPKGWQSNRGVGDTDEPSELILTEILKKWSHRPSGYKKLDHLGHLLVTVPNIFPPKNTKVEPHEYFAKWKTFDKEAFLDVSGDEQKELLKRAVRKAKFFLHPDKLPKDLTDSQALLFKTIWNVIAEREAATLN